MATSQSRSTVSRTALLEAAKTVLREKGYAGLSTREVAMVANAPLSQIHYHFGSKQGLMLELFKYMEAQLFDRQRLLWDNPKLTFSKRWKLACDFLDEDLESGYVNVAQELAAAGWGDPLIGKTFEEIVTRWVQLLSNAAKQFQAQGGSLGPFTPEDIGALVGTLFMGVESLLLTGVEKRGVPLRSSIRKLGTLIELSEKTRHKKEK